MTYFLKLGLSISENNYTSIIRFFIAVGRHNQKKKKTLNLINCTALGKTRREDDDEVEGLITITTKRDETYQRE